jgi:hypothetical protein
LLRATKLDSAAEALLTWKCENSIGGCVEVDSGHRQQQLGAVATSMHAQKDLSSVHKLWQQPLPRSPTVTTAIFSASPSPAETTDARAAADNLAY